VMRSLGMFWQGIAVDGLAQVLLSMVAPCSGKALQRSGKSWHSEACCTSASV